MQTGNCPQGADHQFHFLTGRRVNGYLLDSEAIASATSRTLSTIPTSKASMFEPEQIRR